MTAVIPLRSLCSARFVGNQLEAGSVSMLYLEGLHMTEREVQEVHNLIRQYEVPSALLALSFFSKAQPRRLIMSSDSLQAKMPMQPGL